MKFNFDEWKNLFEKDPIEFEKKKKDFIEETIQSFSMESQPKLRRLQAELDKKLQSLVK